MKNRKVDDSVIEEITKKRKIETDIRLKSRFPKLNKTYDDFVTESQDVLKRVFDHDDLHRIVAHYDDPIYMSLQKGRKLSIGELVNFMKKRSGELKSAKRRPARR